MQMRSSRKLLSLILSMMLIVAMAFCTTACGGNNTGNGSQSEAGGTQETPKHDAQTDDVMDGTEESLGTNAKGHIILGEGKTVFTFTVVDADGNEKVYEIHTDKTTVGDALVELDLIAGEKGPYGLYVTTVDGVTVDYNTDGKYWAFYVNGESSMTGVDSTDVVEGDTYSFKVE